MSDSHSEGQKFDGVRRLVNGFDIYARVSPGPVPSGRPSVVLVHGVIASSRYMIPTATLLSSMCRVYVPDLPGYGKSGKPPRALAVPELADALSAWMPAMGLGRAIFVGNSFGCQVIADLAVRYPERVQRAVLVGPTVDPQARTMVQQGLRLLLDAPRERLSLWPILARDLFDMGPIRAYREVQAMLEDHIEDKLPFIAMPTLVTRGDSDPIAPERWVSEVTRLLFHGSLCAIPGAPHAANYSTPDKLVALLAPFIGQDPGE